MNTFIKNYWTVTYVCILTVFTYNIYTLSWSTLTTSCLPAIQLLPISTALVPAWRILNTCYVPWLLLHEFHILKLVFNNKYVTGSHTVCEMSAIFKDCCNAICDIFAMLVLVVWGVSYTISSHHRFLIWFDI
jgi:hypothetical protein